MGYLTDVLDRLQWCKGQLSAQSVSSENRAIQGMGHYARTPEEFAQIASQTYTDYSDGFCGAVCSLGVLDVAMGNLLLHSETDYEQKTTRDEKWFDWVLTRWMIRLSQSVFEEWYTSYYSSDDDVQKWTLTDLGLKPSIVTWNDNQSTTRDDVYAFMGVLQNEYTVNKLLLLSRLSPAQKREKFRLFGEMHPREVIEIPDEQNYYAKATYNWDKIEFDEDAIMAIVRELMPVQTAIFEVAR